MLHRLCHCPVKKVGERIIHNVYVVVVLQNDH